MQEESDFGSAALQYIKDSEYEIRYDEEASAYVSPNRAQGLRFFYRSSGFTVQPRLHAGGGVVPWRVSVNLQSVGKNPAIPEPQFLSGLPEWVLEKKTAKVTAGDVEVEFNNTEAGMRQNFRVAVTPVGTDSLRLDFSVELENIEMEVDSINNIVYFKSGEANERVLQYADLRVFDALGKSLPAQVIPTGLTTFAIVVDDSTATYPILIDPLLSSFATLTGDGSSSKFGFSVAAIDRTKNASASAGAGIMVGAPYYDVGTHPDAGKVFVFYTETGTLPTTANWTAQGSHDYDYFGWSILGRGGVDFNGDQRTDIAIGAPYYDSGTSVDDGHVFVYYGGAATDTGLPSTSSWDKPGPASYAHAGVSLAAGVFTTSGESDLAVGAPDHSYNSINYRGSVSVFYGGSGGLASYAAWTTYGETAGDHYGWSLAAGQLNGINNDELIIGVPDYHLGDGTTWGAIYLFRGTNAALESTRWLICSGAAQNSKLGYSVAFGFPYGKAEPGCVLVGAPYESDGQTEEGKVYIYKGGSSMDYYSDWSAQMDQAYAHFGLSVSLGDIDDTGDPPHDADDIIIGAPDWDKDGSTLNSGAAFFWYGSTATNGPGANGIPSNVDWSDISTNASARSGFSVGFAPWFTTSNVRGLIIGQPDNGNGSVKVWW